MYIDVHCPVPISRFYPYSSSSKQRGSCPFLNFWKVVCDGYGEESGKALDVVQSLDARVVLRTCLNFPRWRRLEFDSQLLPGRTRGEEGLLYDPVFLILLFGHMLAESPPTSAIRCIEMFRNNIGSLVLRTLASKDAGMREVALLQIVALYKHMATADIQEKPHVLHILTLLKNTIPPSLLHLQTNPIPVYRRTPPSTSRPHYARSSTLLTSLTLSLRDSFYSAQNWIRGTCRCFMGFCIAATVRDGRGSARGL